MIICDRPQCLIAQGYDGAVMMSGAAMSGSYGEVQGLVKEIYNNVHLVQCCGYQLNLILQRALSQNTQGRVFLSSLSEILLYFSRSLQKMSALRHVCD